MSKAVNGAPKPQTPLKQVNRVLLRGESQFKSLTEPLELQHVWAVALQYFTMSLKILRSMGLTKINYQMHWSHNRSDADSPADSAVGIRAKLQGIILFRAYRNLVQNAEVLLPLLLLL